MGEMADFALEYIEEEYIYHERYGYEPDDFVWDEDFLRDLEAVSEDELDDEDWNDQYDDGSWEEYEDD